jgi:hypothetical protein
MNNVRNYKHKALLTLPPPLYASKTNMKQYSIIILIFLFPIGLIAQTDCVDFNDYDSSQIWIKKIIKLDNLAQKDFHLIMN